MAIVSRNTKGSALTHAELDGNFADLDGRISTRQDSSTIISLINNNETLDSAKTINIITATVDEGYVQARQVDLQRDSSFISNIVDSDYVQARQTSGSGSGLDSATAIALIDSDYVQARQTSGGGGSIDSAATIALIDSDYIQIRQITVGGSNTQVQFNDGGSSFGGDAGLVYSKDSDLLTAVNLTVSGTLTTTTAGTPTITANSNLLLKVGGSVVVQADSAGNGAGFRVGTRTTTQRNALSASDGEIIYNSTIGQFDIYQRSAWQPLTKGSAIFNVVNDSSADWAFTDAETHWFPTSENDPVLYLRRGETYYFVVNASGHPFQIRASNGGSAYTTGVTNNGAAVGTVVFKVPMSAPATLYYQCTNHSVMGNTINIV